MTKRKLSILGMVVAAVLICVSAGIKTLDDASVKTGELTKAQQETLEKIRETYQVSNQEQIAEALEQKKAKKQYTDSNMLVEYNPFGTNTQSLYVYFTTEEAVKVSYTVHVDNDDIDDFTREPYQAEEYATEHEYQVIGLVPDMDNEVIFTFTKEDGSSYTKSISYQMGSLLGTEERKLEIEESGDTKQLEEGLYAVMGNDSEALDFMYYYDNEGVLRGEVPLLGYRSHRLIFGDGVMYYSISETKMAEVNRLGEVTQVFSLGEYELHHDYVFDDNGDMLILASDKKQDSIEDIIVKLDVSSGEVEEVLDLGDLFPDYKETCVKNSDGELDWMHINTLQWLGNDEIIISSRETSTILKIGNLYTSPSVEYMIGEEDFWEEHEYASLLLDKNGEFANQGGQHSVTYVQDDSLLSGQYYLYMFNNNIGVSQSQPDYDWSVIDGIQSEAIEGTTSKYYKYLVDETDGTYELVDEFDVPYSGYVSSAQDIGDNTIVNSGFAGLFGEYDENHQLIRQFHMNVEKFIYRVYKYSFDEFYFN